MTGIIFYLYPQTPVPSEDVHSHEPGTSGGGTCWTTPTNALPTRQVSVPVYGKATISYLWNSVYHKLFTDCFTFVLFRLQKVSIGELIFQFCVLLLYLMPLLQSFYLCWLHIVIITHVTSKGKVNFFLKYYECLKFVLCWFKNLNNFVLWTIHGQVF